MSTSPGGEPCQNCEDLFDGDCSQYGDPCTFGEVDNGDSCTIQCNKQWYYQPGQGYTGISAQVAMGTIWSGDCSQECQNWADTCDVDCSVPPEPSTLDFLTYSCETCIPSEEICGNDKDEDCNGYDMPCAFDDYDGDGVPYTEDCDDHNPNIPSTEICGNDIDEDCSGADLPCSFDDYDGDGIPYTEDCNDHDATNTKEPCVYGPPEPNCVNDCDTDDDGDGYSENQGDADDADPDVNPHDTPEHENPDRTDKDGDGWVESKDCDDNDINRSPGTEEFCGDGIDQDCDGHDIPCDAENEDYDGDGYNYTQDCNDRDKSIHPGADEICGDGIDQDCDNKDAECPADDRDGDGTPNESDCAPDNPAIHPGATEICGNNIDEDCSGADEICSENDKDGDGVPSEEDCDDNAALSYPGAPEICGDGIDQDCDGSDETCKDCKFTLAVSGPGHVTGTEPSIKCSDRCEGGVPCPGSVTLTAVPNIAQGQYKWTVPPECSVSGAVISCVVDNAQTIDISIVFNDLCTSDTDGDSVKDYLDSNPDEDSSGIKAWFSEAFILVTDILVKKIAEETGLEEEQVKTAAVLQAELLKILSNATPSKELDAILAPDLAGSANAWIVYKTSDGIEFEVGDESVKEKDGNIIGLSCNPQFEYCNQFSLADLENLVPCDPLLEPKLPPSDPGDLPEIPDGIYSSDPVNPDCGCFKTVEHNTAATVEGLKQIVSVNQSINDNLIMTNRSIDSVKTSVDDGVDKIVTAIKENRTGDFDDFTPEDAQSIVDKQNEDASKLHDSDVEPIDQDDLEDNNLMISTDDTDQITEKLTEQTEGYNTDVNEYSTTILSSISNKFQINVTDATCSFSAPVFGEFVEFDACPYEGILNTMGNGLRFLSYLYAAFILLKS